MKIESELKVGGQFYKRIELIHYLLRHFEINVLKMGVCLHDGVWRSKNVLNDLSHQLFHPHPQKINCLYYFLKHNTNLQPHTMTIMTWTDQDTVFHVESFVNTVIFSGNYSKG